MYSSIFISGVYCVKGVQTIKMFKKVLSVLFSVILLFSVCIGCATVKSEETSGSKAIIVVPGLFSGGLFYRDKTCRKYYKNEAIWMPLDSKSKWRMLKGVAKFKLFNKDLFCDENGNPINKNIGLALENEEFPHPVDANVAKYSVGDSCRKLVDSLTEQFKDYEVILHNYDWRLDINKAADSLTKEIQKHDEVILIGYSLGGIVSCKSAVKIKELGQLDKIKKYISVAVPYNGTVEPFYVLNKGMLTENDFMGRVIRFLGIHNIIKNMAKNCGITYQMLPSKEYFKRAQRGYITNTKGKTLDYDETLEFLKNCSFMKKTDGSTKAFLNEPHKLYDGLIVDGKHILNFLNYHIIAGCGLDTMSEIGIGLKKSSNIRIKNYVDGDGSVAFNESAIPFDGIDNSRIFKVKGRHQFLIGDDKVIKNIIDTIKNNALESNEKFNLAV